MTLASQLEDGRDGPTLEKMWAAGPLASGGSSLPLASVCTHSSRPALVAGMVPLKVPHGVCGMHPLLPRRGWELPSHYVEPSELLGGQRRGITRLCATTTLTYGTACRAPTEGVRGV